MRTGLHAAAWSVYAVALFYQLARLYRGEATVWTAVLFYLTVGLIGSAAARRLTRSRRSRKDLAVRISLAVWVSCGALFAGELVLRQGGKRLSYSERNGDPHYRSPYLLYRQANRAGYPGARLLLWPAGSSRLLEQPEFSFVHRYNSLGLRDEELPPDKPPGEYRIFALGDSFTEGVGANQSATWPRLLEGALQTAHPRHRYRVLNAGVAGSDPIFELALLERRLLAGAPDLVIVALNSSDVDDVVVRGGAERFRPDGSLRYRDGPWWEPVYGFSFIARHVVHDLLGYDYLLAHPERTAARRGEAIEAIGKALARFVELSRQHDFELLVVVHPLRHELSSNAETLDRLVGLAGSIESLDSLDVRSRYLRVIRRQSARGEDFYWPLDGHHNARGYQVLADAVLQGMTRRGLTRPRSASPPTFNRTIAPIIFRHCTPCHRSGQIGPFQLTRYEEVARRADKIARATARGYMPPWLADPDYRSFAQERLISRREIAAIGKWVEAGSPEGDGAAPPPAAFLPHRVLDREPDKRVCMSEPYRIRPSETDTYRTFVLPLDLQQDRELVAVAFSPGNPRIVHHAVVYVADSGSFLELDAADPDYGFDSWQGMKRQIKDVLPGYWPGLEPVAYPEGTGKKIGRGEYLLVNMHYPPTRTMEQDRSCVDLYYSREPLRHRVTTLRISEADLLNPPLFIPAGETRSFTMRKRFDKSLDLITLYPHMHYRGKSMLAYAVTPGGQRIPLLKIDRWSFNWQGSYTFRRPVRIPAGSEFHVHAVFDNTPENPANPVLPPVDAIRGRSSHDEMLILGMEVVEVRDRA